MKIRYVLNIKNNYEQKTRHCKIIFRSRNKSSSSFWWRHWRGGSKLSYTLIVQKATVFFPETGRENKALILTYLDSPMPMVKLFHEKYLLFTLVQSWAKKQNFGTSYSRKNSDFSVVLQISVTLDRIWGSKDPKTLQKWALYGYWFGTQNFWKYLTW